MIVQGRDVDIRWLLYLLYVLLLLALQSLVLLLIFLSHLIRLVVHDGDLLAMVVVVLLGTWLQSVIASAVHVIRRIRHFLALGSKLVRVDVTLGVGLWSHLVLFSSFH